MSKDKVKEITQDLANAIIRGDNMVPACNVGALLEYIESLKLKISDLEDDIDLILLEKNSFND